MRVVGASSTTCAHRRSAAGSDRAACWPSGSARAARRCSLPDLRANDARADAGCHSSASMASCYTRARSWCGATQAMPSERRHWFSAAERGHPDAYARAAHRAERDGASPAPLVPCPTRSLAGVLALRMSGNGAPAAALISHGAGKCAPMQKTGGLRRWRRRETAAIVAARAAKDSLARAPRGRIFSSSAARVRVQQRFARSAPGAAFCEPVTAISRWRRRRARNSHIVRGACPGGRFSTTPGQLQPSRYC